MIQATSLTINCIFASEENVGRCESDFRTKFNLQPTFQWSQNLIHIMSIIKYKPTNHNFFLSSVVMRDQITVCSQKLRFFVQFCTFKSRQREENATAELMRLRLYKER